MAAASAASAARLSGLGKEACRVGQAGVAGGRTGSSQAGKAAIIETGMMQACRQAGSASGGVGDWAWHGVSAATHPSACCFQLLPPSWGDGENCRCRAACIAACGCVVGACVAARLPPPASCSAECCASAAAHPAAALMVRLCRSVHSSMPDCEAPPQRAVLSDHHQQLVQSLLSFCA